MASSTYSCQAMGKKHTLGGIHIACNVDKLSEVPAVDSRNKTSPVMRKILFHALLLHIASLSWAQKDTLYVYGPGGPLAPMQEAGERFTRQTRIPVKVVAGPEAVWIESAKNNADLIFGGAEYMLTSFSMQHKGLVDSTTRTELYKRGAAILVRPGNPKKITSLKDLARSGVRLLDVNGAGQLGLWEDLAGRQDLIAGIQKNIRRSFANTALAIDAWKSDTAYDAWIIYASWHYRLKDVTQLVKIPPGQTLYRGTPIALTTITDQKEAAQEFIRFLQTPAIHRVFQKWGWE